MNVLIAIDGSEESIESARFVSRLPFSEKPKITVVSALDESPYDMITTDEGRRLEEAERQALQKSYVAVERILKETCSEIQQVVAMRHPRRLILDTAKEQDADLIVLGARGHSAVYRVVLGSTADFVANHASCSVLVVRPTEDSDDQSEEFKVLLACDGSAHAAEAYSQLASFDWSASNTDIRVAMMLERPSLVPPDVVYDPVLIDESQAKLKQLEAKHNISCPVNRHVGETLHIGNGIVSLAAREDCNLLFVGGSGKSALARFFLGSTSRYALHHAHCPVWIAREKKWE